MNIDCMFFYLFCLFYFLVFGLFLFFCLMYSCVCMCDDTVVDKVLVDWIDKVFSNPLVFLHDLFRAFMLLGKKKKKT